MLIKDSSNLPRLTAGNRREAHRQDIVDSIGHKTAATVRDYEASPTNPLRQWGKAMRTLNFEKKLTPLLPGAGLTNEEQAVSLGGKVQFLPHPSNPSKRVAWFVSPDGTRAPVCIYESEIMPEHSIMHTKFVDVPDMSVDFIDTREKLRAEFVSPEEGFIIDPTGGPLPGYKRVEVVDSEAVRGWRTVLLYFISALLITPQQAETTFGPDDRREWAHKTGKQHAPTLW